MATPRQRPKADPKAAIQDWITLVEPDGAFLTISELTATFPHGFEQMDRDLRTELRAGVADLDDAEDPATRRNLANWLLGTVLEWDDLFAEGQRIPATATVRATEHGVTLHPHYVLLDADDATKVRLGLFTWPTGTALDRRVDPATSGDAWPASPVQRAETWCRESGTPLALVTDDDAWVLVWAPRGAPAASCRWTFSDLADETILQAGLVSLLGARRFFAVPDDPKIGQTLERLFERAADAEAELTRGLGTSVRRSVELIAAAISRDDVAHDGKVLAGVAATEVYESAVTVLMRLVFLLFAEERRLLPAEDPLWAESYSVLTLRDDLRQVATRDGLDSLDRRATAWHRLLATFRAVHGGVNHDRLTLPAYGGSLFDPNRFPFLEGRRASDHLVAGGVDLGPAPDAETGPNRPVVIDDRTVLAVLDSLLTVQVKSGRSKVAQRVSYKALEVEEIGHCYEGLLDHSCIRVDELAVGLVGREGNEPEIAVAELEEFADDRDALCEFLSDKTRCNKKATALAQLFDQEPEGVDLARLRIACGHNDDTVDRVRPYWGLVRPDLRGLPLVLLPGSMFVTQTSTRRNTGTQYTTKALAEEVAQYALEPLVYDPGPQNEADQTKWKLNTPAAILDLRVCDPAVGSGAILTAAGRYLADRLVESVLEYGPGEGPFGTRLRDLAVAPAEEQTVLARREVVDHCLYGVDKNPVAAEMAKLSLWLTTMARERPFTFLDHAIQVGDSLLGTTDIDQLRWLHLDPPQRQGQPGFEALALDRRLKEATDLARRLRDMSVVTVRNATEKERLHRELQTTLGDLEVVGDGVVGTALSIAGKRRVPIEGRLDSQMERIHAALDNRRSELERGAALSALHDLSTGWLRTDLPDEIPTQWDRQCLHWVLAFPEVFLDSHRRGFDAVVGNPPFLGANRVTELLGDAYSTYLATLFPPFSKRVDLCAFFFRRATSILRTDGVLGFLATNTISQGQTRKGGLDQLIEAGHEIYRARSSFEWPGEGSVVASAVWMCERGWAGTRSLDAEEVIGISSLLDASAGAAGFALPEKLKMNRGNCYMGCVMWGEEFYLDEAAAANFVMADERNRKVIRPAVGGRELNSLVRPQPSRWVLDFGEMSEQEASTFEAPFGFLAQHLRPKRLELDAKKYKRIVEGWWKYFHARMTMYEAIGERRLDRVLSRARTSDHHELFFIDSDAVFLDSVIVFLHDDFAHYGVLQSDIHEAWARTFASSLGSGMRYGVGTCYDTFPLPPLTNSDLEEVASTHYSLRSDAMQQRGIGAVELSKLVSDPSMFDSDIEALRGAICQVNEAVRDAYGWSDIDLGQGHRPTARGAQFTVSAEARSTLVYRLLELNQERYAEEVAAGLHGKHAKRATRTKTSKVSKGQGSLE